MQESDYGSGYEEI